MCVCVCDYVFEWKSVRDVFDLQSKILNKTWLFLK